MQSFGYQKEIDGLRAWAIIPVILYHFSVNLSPNGYLGVDLFFVISGFVITKTILREKNKVGSFKVVNFFLKRVKRIYPALIFMVITSSILISYLGVLNFSNFHFYFKTAIFSIIGISNIFLIYKSDNYFLNEENNPYTHTWSLGVEEQFYLIYPIILVTIFKFSSKNHFIKRSYFVLVMLIIFSLYFFFYSKSIIGNFYSPFIRMWELSLGCLAFFIFSNKNITIKLYSILYVLILIIIFFFELSVINFKIKTLIISFSTFFFLIQRKIDNNYIENLLLKNHLFVYLGKISYSLYLWHLPVIYISSIYFSNYLFFIISIILIFSISIFSYEFIETPFRKKLNLDLYINNLIKISPAIFIIILTVILWNGLYNSKIIINNYFTKIYSTTNNFNYINKKFNLGDRVLPNYYLNGNDISNDCFIQRKSIMSNENFLNSKCLKKKNNLKLFVLNGDCHAQHFIPMIDKSKFIDNLFFIGDVSLSTLSEKCLINNLCNKNEKITKINHEISIKKINDFAKTYDEVILINKLFLTEKNANMNLDNYYNVFDLFLNKLNKNIKIIFIEPTVTFDYGPESCVIVGKKCSTSLNKGVKYQKKISNIYKELSINYKNVFVFNPNPILCKDNNCLIYDKKSDFLLYKDNDNLSVEASLYLTKFFDKWLIEKIKINE